MNINEAILEAACFILRSRFRFVAIQAARGPESDVESTCIYATRGAMVAHGVAVADMMRKNRERILSACGRANVIAAVERGEVAP